MAAPMMPAPTITTSLVVGLVVLLMCSLAPA
jgi:hypothetical protein